MVKYKHCEKCKSIYSTEPWIGEVHTYIGICPSCMEEEPQECQIQKDIVEDDIVETQEVEKVEGKEVTLETIQTPLTDTDRILLNSLEQKANEVLSGDRSINVLIKEIKDDLVGKAKQRIEETFQSFDAGKIDAQKAIDYAERILDYLSEYKEYMDNVIIKLHDKPKIKVKAAIDKVLKESISDIPKDISKDILLNRKAILNIVSDKAKEWYNFYSDTKDALNITSKMVLHPFKEIQDKLNSLPFYNSS
ncbi:MAG: hypothetical protein ACFFDB_19920 [Promethearchaeota archaeon]